MHQHKTELSRALISTCHHSTDLSPILLIKVSEVCLKEYTGKEIRRVLTSLPREQTIYLYRESIEPSLPQVFFPVSQQVSCIHFHVISLSYTNRHLCPKQMWACSCTHPSLLIKSWFRIWFHFNPSYNDFFPGHWIASLASVSTLLSMLLASMVHFDIIILPCKIQFKLKWSHMKMIWVL